jgi:16S rRNA (cytosine1407-C5)-methyltransferase
MKNYRELLPKQFLERLILLYGNKHLDEILEAFATDRPTTFRINNIKKSVDTILQALKKCNISVDSLSWISGGFQLLNTSLRELQETEVYKNGEIYVQSPSSMIPSLVLDPKPDEKILDLTAAPGSKTTQIAALMENTGQIIANDNSPIRIHKLKANLEMQGVTNTKVTNIAGQIFWQTYPEFFDKTLLDAPCSMEGRYSIKLPEESGEWSMKRIQSLADRQKWLLRSAVSATKSGGYIVYSTCTLSPEENEEVIAWILKKEKGAVILEDISIDHLSMNDGLIQWKTKQFPDEMKKTKRIAPSKDMEGFFIAKLKKIRPTIHGILPVSE